MLVLKVSCHDTLICTEEVCVLRGEGGGVEGVDEWRVEGRSGRVKEWRDGGVEEWVEVGVEE